MSGEYQTLNEDGTVELVTFTDAPDERLFIMCACGHQACYHTHATSCQRNCTCSATRREVYESGRIEATS